MEGLESFFTSGQQFNLFLLSFLFGLPIGIFYDIFRVIRLLIKHGKAAVIIEDIIFFIFYGIFLMCFTVTAARSEFRFYYVFGNLLGFIVYFATVGNIVLKLLRRLTEGIKKLLKPPIKKIALICEKIIKKFVGSSQKIKSDKKTLD